MEGELDGRRTPKTWLAEIYQTAKRRHVDGVVKSDGMGGRSVEEVKIFFKASRLETYSCSDVTLG